MLNICVGTFARLAVALAGLLVRLKVGALCVSETLVTSTRPHGVTVIASTILSLGLFFVYGLK
jgi:hypothetical protein